jgi:hypothetical protein
MKKWDIFIVRFLPFVLFIIYGLNVWSAILDKEPFMSYELHGNSVLYALSLFAISLANKRYHCVWNRAMYVFLVFVPLFNYIDSVFYIVETEEVYMSIIHISYGLTALITAFLAIRHFIQASKRRLDNGRS